MTTLAQRAMAAGWQWSIGHRCIAVYIDGRTDINRGTVIAVEPLPLVHWDEPIGDGRGSERYYDHIRGHHPTEHLLPDFEHPETALSLLVQVRRAYGDVGAFACHAEMLRSWGCWREGGDARYASGYTETEALVAALEAAP